MRGRLEHCVGHHQLKVVHGRELQRRRLAVVLCHVEKGLGDGDGGAGAGNREEER
jgi:hypothetical protein